MRTRDFIKRSCMMLLAGCAVCISLGACSNDEQDETDNEKGSGTSGVVDPSKVFTGERPKAVAGMSIAYNTEGLVTGINDKDGTKVTFEYHNVTRAVDKSRYVRMTVVDDETFVFDMVLNEQGFVKHCDEIDTDDGTDTWDFEYTEDGLMNYMKRSEGGNEVTRVTYQNGDAIKMTMVSEDDPDDSQEADIYYTSDKVTTPIENKGCLMLFDNALRVDLDEMEYAYYAGLLGKATKHLPVKNSDYTLNWTLNDKGYPTQLVIPEGMPAWEYTYTFEW